MAKEVRGTPGDGATAGLQPPAGDGDVGAPGTPAANGPSGDGASVVAASEAGAPATPQEALPAESAQDQQRYSVLRPEYDRVSSELDVMKTKLAEVETARDTALGTVTQIEEALGPTDLLLAAAKQRVGEAEAQAAPVPAVAPDAGFAAPGLGPAAQGAQIDPRAAWTRHVEDKAVENAWSPLEMLQYARQVERQTGVRLLDDGAPPQPQGQQFDAQKFGQDILAQARQERQQEDAAGVDFDEALEANSEAVEAAYGREWFNEKVVVPTLPNAPGLKPGREMRRGKLAERFCELTGSLDMETALYAVDPKAVIALRASQLADEIVDERLRVGQGTMQLTPGAVVGGPQPVSVDAEMGQQIETEGEFAVGEPPPVDL